MLVPDDRFFVLRASAALPAPEARAALTFRAWERILIDLANAVYIDVLLWAAQVAKGKLALSGLVDGLTEVLKEAGSPERKQGDDVAWNDGWSRFQGQVLTVLGSRLGQPLAGLTLDEADLVVGDILREAPQPFVPKEYSEARSVRQRMLGEALAGILEALPEGPVLDDPFREYLALEPRRDALEREATDDVRMRLRGASFDIVLPVRVAVTAQLPVSLEALGFDLSKDAPSPDLKREAPGALYACFMGVQATGSDHAVEYARRRVRVALARAGMFADDVVGFEILDASVRHAGSPFWGTGDRGWRIWGASLGDDSFTAVTDIADLLVADDELAVRIQEAIVHLHRAGLTADSEGAFDVELPRFGGG